MTDSPPAPIGVPEAAAILRAGGVVAFPTETVYGLGADALDADAVARVFETKGRPASNPLIVHVADAAMARSVTNVWPATAQRIAERCWPGPVTLVLPKHEAVPGVLTGGGGTVAVRVPEHPVALALLRAFGGPMVGPSANPSGSLSPTTAAHVLSAFGGRVPVVDGGACRVGIESTVVRVEADRLTLLRPGVAGGADLAACAGVPIHDNAGGAADGSPGRLGPHYRPSASVRLVDRAPAPEGGVVVLSEPGGAGREGVIAMPAEASAYAARLYAALREADGAHPESIVVVRPTGDGPIWEAVRERLARASAG